MLILVNDWIKHAETKAAGILAAAGVSAGILYNLVKGAEGAGQWLCMTSALSVIFIILTGFSSALALRPRLVSRGEPTSHLYFDHIARSYPRAHGASGYKKVVRELTVDDDMLIGEIADQIWANAHVARAKYCWANAGLISLILTLISLAATALTVISIR